MVYSSKIRYEVTPFEVAIWPDGDWAKMYDDFLGGDYSHKSDDYETLNLNDAEAMKNYHDQPKLQEILDELYRLNPDGSI